MSRIWPAVPPPFSTRRSIRSRSSTARKLCLPCIRAARRCRIKTHSQREIRVAAWRQFALLKTETVCNDDSLDGAQNSLLPTATMPCHFAVPSTPVGNEQTDFILASITSTDDVSEGAQTKVMPVAAMPLHFCSPLPLTPHSRVLISLVLESNTSTDEASNGAQKSPSPKAASPSPKAASPNHLRQPTTAQSKGVTISCLGVNHKHRRCIEWCAELHPPHRRDVGPLE